MDYTLELTVPANTPEMQPVSTEYKVVPGAIAEIAPVLPTGCNDMVKWRLLMDETPICPVTAGGWMRGNGVMGPFPEDIQVPPGGARLQLVACSPGTIYSHDIYVVVDILEPGTTLEDLRKALTVSFGEA